MMEFYYELSNNTYECTLRYSVECSMRERFGESKMCTNWGSRCGLDDLVTISGATEEKTNITHVLYALGRFSGVILASTSSLTSEEQERVARGKRNALIHNDEKIRIAEREAAFQTNNLRTGRDYVPELEEKQDVLTFLIAVGSWAAEFLVSSPFWAAKVWWLVIIRAFVRF